MKTLVTKLSSIVKAIQTQLAQWRQRISAWYARRWRAILRAVIVLSVAGVTGAALLYLWQRSPTFRAAVLGAAAGGVGLWGWLKGSARDPGPKVQPAAIRVPTLRPESNTDEKLPLGLS